MISTLLLSLFTSTSKYFSNSFVILHRQSRSSIVHARVVLARAAAGCQRLTIGSFLLISIV